MEGSWRTLFFSVFLASVLLVSCVSNEQTSTCTPTVSLDELGLATVRAARVFEGRLEVLGGPPASSPSRFVAGRLNATFSFRRAHKGKGKFKRISQATPLVVRLDLTGDNAALKMDSVAGCSLSDQLALQRNYLVFVSESVQTENSEGQSGVVFFEATAFPVPWTKDAVKQITAYQCRKCGKWFLSS